MLEREFCLFDNAGHVNRRNAALDECFECVGCFVPRHHIFHGIRLKRMYNARAHDNLSVIIHTLDGLTMGEKDPGLSCFKPSW